MAAHARAPVRRFLMWAGIMLSAFLIVGGGIFGFWYKRITTPPARLDADARLLEIEGARLAAEWEPATGVLIAWPLRLPRELVVALAGDVHLYVTAREANRDAAAAALAEWGIPASRCTFIATSQGDGWYGTRDWGPFTVLDGAGQCHLVDARYTCYPVSGPAARDTLYWLSRLESLDFAPDDRAPEDVALALGLPRVELQIALAGGACETDGRGTVIVTEAVLRENEALGVSADRFRAVIRSALGVERLIVVPNYEVLGVHHVDCLLKFLDPGRIMVKRPPKDHPQYRRVEKVIATLARQTAPGGGPYEIVRIDTPRYFSDDLANYTNALILNRTVHVPLFGIAADEQALATWRSAMPGYEIRGYLYAGEEGWTYTDALHCRVRAIHAAREAPGASEPVP